MGACSGPWALEPAISAKAELKKPCPEEGYSSSSQQHRSTVAIVPERSELPNSLLGLWEDGPLTVIHQDFAKLLFSTAGLPCLLAGKACQQLQLGLEKSAFLWKSQLLPSWRSTRRTMFYLPKVGFGLICASQEANPSFCQSLFSAHTGCVVHVWFVFPSGGLSGLSSWLLNQLLPDDFGIPSFGFTAEAAAPFLPWVLDFFECLSGAGNSDLGVTVPETFLTGILTQCHTGLLSMEKEGFLNGWYVAIFQPLPVSAFLTVRSRHCLYILSLSPF